jgi:hypothetical protein
MRTTYRIVLLCVMLAFIVAAFAPAAFATSQWARKYQASCRDCHSAFPRLNHYGQRFMRNGYQDPDADEADGDTFEKTQINDATFIDKLGNLFGVRLSVTPIGIKTNKLTDADGKKQDQMAYGNTDWVQFFVAGSIYKNTSIFIEMAFDDRGYHYSWYKFGFHNWFDSTWGNLIVGNVPARDYGCYPNRLRIMGPVKADVFNVKSSGGASSGDIDGNALNASGSRPALQYYGYQGPVLLWGGVSPGDNGKSSDIGWNANDKIHYWAGGRLEVPTGSEWEGTGVSAWYYNGTDTGDGGDRYGPYENEYTRTTFDTEVRWGEFEFMGTYLMGKDANWALDDTDTEIEYNGYSLIGAYMQVFQTGQSLYYVLQYDNVDSDDVESLVKQYVTPSISWFPRENIRIGLYSRFDMRDVEDDEKLNEYYINIRTMF